MRRTGVSTAGALLAWILAGGGVEPADGAQVLCQVDPESSASVEVTVSVVSRGGQALDLEQVGTCPGSLSLQLPAPGLFEIRLARDGFWAEPRVEWLEEESQVAVTLVPTGHLRRRVVPPPGESLPAALTLRFRPAEKGRPEAIFESRVKGGGETRCGIEEGWSLCEVPQGRWNLRAWADGAVPAYQWGVEVAAGESCELPPLALRRGASVAGWVPSCRGFVAEGEAPPCRVELSPYDFSMGDSPSEETAGPVAGPVQPSGFFQLVDVPPGRYVAAALQTGFVPERFFPVPVFPHVETALPEPLRISPPATLEVAVSPAEDLLGRPWSIALFRRGQGQNQEPVVEGEPSEAGRWRKQGLSHGRYLLIVDDADGGTWETREVELGSEWTREAVELAFLPVSGRLLLGEEPLVAKLWFEGLPAPTDREGRFAVVLPRPGRWLARIRAQDPQVQRDLWVEVEPGRELEIVLPDNRVAGVVVDEAGAPAEGAIVIAGSTEPVEHAVHTRTDARGRFAFRGLNRGELVLRAESGSRRSETTKLNLDGQQKIETRLVLRSTRVVTGVLGAPDRGVPGAQIAVFPNGELVTGDNASTDLYGRFRLEVPATATRVYLALFPPHHAFDVRLVTLPPEDEELVVPAEPLGGTLVLEGLAGQTLAPKAPGFDPARNPILFRDGLVLPLPFALHWLALNGISPEQDPLVLPDLAPGQYSLCTVALGSLLATSRAGPPPPPDDGCQSGYLPPGGELRLALAP